MLIWWVLDVDSDSDSKSTDQDVVRDLQEWAGDDTTKESITTVNDESDSSLLPPISRKRKRPTTQAHAVEEEEGRQEFKDKGDGESEDESHDESEAEACQSWVISKLSARRQKPVIFSCVRLSDFIYPKSLYDGWEPPLPRSRESAAIKELLVSCKNPRPNRRLQLTIEV